MRSIIHSAISSNPCALSPPRSRRLLLVSIGFAALFVAVAAGGAPPGFTTSVKPYAISISPESATNPIRSLRPLLFRHAGVVRHRFRSADLPGRRGESGAGDLRRQRGVSRGDLRSCALHAPAIGPFSARKRASASPSDARDGADADGGRC